MTTILLILHLVGCKSSDTSNTTEQDTTSSQTTAATSIACPDPPAACIDQSRYQADLEAFSILRTPGSEGWQEVQDACVTELSRLGFAVERHDYGSGINVIGRQAGTATSPRTIIVSAHYDHIDECSGADDNASGVAGVLEVARVLAGRSHANDLVVACWDEEEAGLIGSMAYASEVAAAGADIAVAISLEMIAYADTSPNSQTIPVGFDLLFADATATVVANDYRGDFIALVADESAAATTSALLAAAPSSLPMIPLELTTELATNPALADLQRSDHASFWQEGYPAIMLTDTANFRYSGYHCGDGVDDTIDRLDMVFATDVVESVAGGVLTMLEPR